MKIISASRREDMPAFDMRRLLEKYEEYGPDIFWVLWTKNPRNILLNCSALDFKRTALQQRWSPLFVQFSGRFKVENSFHQAACNAGYPALGRFQYAS